MLALAEIEEGHYGGFFILWRITFQDLGDQFVVYVVEFEGNFGVIAGRVAMLEDSASRLIQLGMKTHDLESFARHGACG